MHSRTKANARAPRKKDRMYASSPSNVFLTKPLSLGSLSLSQSILSRRPPLPALSSGWAATVVAPSSRAAVPQPLVYAADPQASRRPDPFCCH